MNQGYPGYPPQPSNSQGYPPQPSVGFNPATPYPPQTNFPTPGGSAYPPTNTGYPPANSAAGYPPTQTPGAYPPQPSTNAAGYPGAAPAYAPQYGYQQQMPGAVQQTYPGQMSGAVQQTYPGQMSGAAQQAYPGQMSGAAQQTYPGQMSGAAQQTYPGQTSYPLTSGGYQATAPTNSHYPSAHVTTTTPGEIVTPTVRPVSPFDPQSDAKILRRAMKGLGTDEKAIINVLAKRTNRQRQEIAVQFKTNFGKDLVKDLVSETSGKLQQLLVAMMRPTPEFLAEELNHAISGIGTIEKTIIEIVCTASNTEINQVKQAYSNIYRRSLEKDLEGDTSGYFRRLLVSMVQGKRSEQTFVNEGEAVRDAQALLFAGKLVLGTDESVFNSILCTRSYPQLRRIFMEYQKIANHTMEKAIRDEFSGDIKDGLLAIVKSVENKAAFFAGRINDAIRGFGTNDRQLIRVVVWRSEIDMENIKREYRQCYKKSMEQDISDDVSGDYKKLLLALIS